MSSRLYIGRIADGVKGEELEKLLKACGKLREFDFKTGYAYVEYKDYKSAHQAVQTLNGKSLNGQSILVEHAKANGTVGGYSIAGGYSAKSVKMPPPVRTAHRIRVENLSTRVKWMELKEFLNTAGEVTFADAHKRKAGEGIVEFASKEDMLKAIKQLDNNEFYGRRVRLVEEPIFGRPVSRSRSRSISRSRRHTRSSSKEKKRAKRKSRSRSKEKSRSRRSRSNSRSRRRHSKTRSRSASKSGRRRTRSRSRERSKSPKKRKPKSPSKSPERSKPKKSKKKKRSRSHSRSKSPEIRKKKKKPSHKSDSDSSSDSNDAENGN